MKAAEYATVGDNCIDRFKAPVNLSLVGGNALNVAVQMQKLGLPTAYFGAVGPDEGALTKRLLRQNNVNIDHLRTVPGVTAYTEIDSTPEGDRIFAFEEFGVCQGYAPIAADMIALKAMKHVHIGWLNDQGALRRALVGAGVSVSQDVTVNADPENLGVDGLTIAFASAGEDAELAEEIAHSLRERGARIAVVTRGALGAVATDGDQKVETTIRAVKVVDTTGAGDSFIAGFLASFTQAKPLQDCLEGGRDAAALTCAHAGGFPQ